MFQKICTIYHDGIRARRLDIEVDILPGLPAIHMIGVSETVARGVRERVHSAFLAAGFSFPAKRITVNLRCPDTARLKAGLDLPVALGILCADLQAPCHRNATTAVIGDLSLNGDIHPVQRIGSFGPLVHGDLAKAGISSILVPAGNTAEASLLPDLEILPVATLAEAAALWCGRLTIDPLPHVPLHYARPPADTLLSIRGQLAGKRALMVACAGGHNLLFLGPPGCGKTLLAQAAPCLLPVPSEEDLQHLLMIRALSETHLTQQVSRPIRSPHHSITAHALIGGGRPIQPGEITRADHGLLILDEAAEFATGVLEHLRTPLESHQIRLRYLDQAETLPADFMLVGTTNLCPCGQFPSPACSCSLHAIRRYQGRLSTALIERIDLCVLLDAVPDTDRQVYTPADVTHLQEQIQQAADRQRSRFRKESFTLNSRIPPGKIETYCKLHPSAASLFREACARFHLSLRTRHNLLKTARSIADLADQEQIGTQQIAEALQYRPKGFLSGAMPT
ncbi:MAG: ATP-binding protein [Clostridiales bacterium]|nr:ATP-binding protein [Clostridiales bacterium]